MRQVTAPDPGVSMLQIKGRRDAVDELVGLEKALFASRPSSARSQIAVARALMPTAVAVGGGAAATLLTTYAFTGRNEALVMGLVTLVVAVIGVWQWRLARPRPLVILGVASIALAAVVPVIGGTAQVLILPAFAALAFVGIFSLPRRTALVFSIWSGILGAWALPWLIPDPGFTDGVIGLILILAIGVSAWRLLSVVGDVARGEEETYRLLFDSSPVAIMEEDFTAVELSLEALRDQGVHDLRDYLRDHPEVTVGLISQIRIRRTNPTAVRMIEGGSAEAVPDAFAEAERHDVELSSFIEEFVAIWEGRTQVALDLEGVTLEGRPLEAVLHWSVPLVDGRQDLSRVIVTISDITPRKEIEQRLAEAVESNKRMLTFEQALAACSRALLVGSGEDALEVGLESLRMAIGADRAYLAVNDHDRDLGACFRVVSSASKPEYARDDWVGVAVPWSKYATAWETLSGGKPFQHIAVESHEEGWNRSLLAVPVLSGGRWTATIGFVDIARRTRWGEEAVRMLEVASPMIGTFREREATRRRLEELVRSKDRFIASVSHELRTPLAAVLGFADELKNHADSFQPGEIAEILELIADQSHDMTDMVEDLLVAARADIGTISIRPQEVYLRSQTEAALAVLGSDAIEKVRVVGDAGRAWADPTRTRQVIRNLLTNAIRYGGDVVTVTALTGNERTILRVCDDGPGLPETEWQRIFEPYERAHDQPSQPASIGLGLTVSRQLARLMGGDLSYCVEENGSVFELALPADEGAQPLARTDLEGSPILAAATHEAG